MSAQRPAASSSDRGDVLTLSPVHVTLAATDSSSPPLPWRLAGNRCAPSEHRRAWRAWRTTSWSCSSAASGSGGGWRTYSKRGSPPPGASSALQLSDVIFFDTISPNKTGKGDHSRHRACGMLAGLARPSESSATRSARARRTLRRCAQRRSGCVRAGSPASGASPRPHRPPTASPLRALRAGPGGQGSAHPHAPSQAYRCARWAAAAHGTRPACPARALQAGLQACPARAPVAGYSELAHLE